MHGDERVALEHALEAAARAVTARARDWLHNEPREAFEDAQAQLLRAAHQVLRRAHGGAALVMLQAQHKVVVH